MEHGEYCAYCGRPVDINETERGLSPCCHAPIDYGVEAEWEEEWDRYKEEGFWLEHPSEKADMRFYVVSAELQGHKDYGPFYRALAALRAKEVMRLVACT